MHIGKSLCRDSWYKFSKKQVLYAEKSRLRMSFEPIRKSLEKANIQQKQQIMEVYIHYNFKTKLSACFQIRRCAKLFVCSCIYKIQKGAINSDAGCRIDIAQQKLKFESTSSNLQALFCKQFSVGLTGITLASVIHLEILEFRFVFGSIC